MVIVTHRQSLIDLAERMIVIDDGKVVSDGPRQKVIESLQAGRVERAK
jgi:ATP-binding cassette subfamily C protein LapB